MAVKSRTQNLQMTVADQRETQMPDPTPPCGPSGCTPVVDNVPIEKWEIVYFLGMNVRSADDTTATVLGSKDKGSFVRGRLHGDWLSLEDEPGFMLTVSGKRNLLQQVSGSSPEKVPGAVDAEAIVQNAVRVGTPLLAQMLSDEGPPAQAPHCPGNHKLLWRCFSMLLLGVTCVTPNCNRTH